ncbi:MAG: hypothetical protein JXR76_27925 [Deltaproteobacteria bacterium]|nr:hypothetical protein [Deltaproteobacteria bacterium]
MNRADKELKVADSAYITGNFKVARDAATQILDNEESTDDQKIAARQILKSIEFDPVAAVGFGITLFVLLFLSIKFLF